MRPATRRASKTRSSNVVISDPAGIPAFCSRSLASGIFGVSNVVSGRMSTRRAVMASDGRRVEPEVDTITCAQHVNRDKELRMEKGSQGRTGSTTDVKGPCDLSLLAATSTVAFEASIPGQEKRSDWMSTP